MILELLPRTELDCYYTDVGRIYKTPDGDFESVTTVLGNYYGNDWLIEWKKLVGEEKAKEVSEQATAGGSKLHAVMEKFLLNESYESAHSIEKMRFNSVKRNLTENVTKVYGVEFPLFSKKLRTAGKADAVVEWKGEGAILDLKTTKSRKSEKMVESYFVQTATYGTMINESFASPFIKKVVVMFSVSDYSCYYFEKPIEEYTQLVNKVFINSRCA